MMTRGREKSPTPGDRRMHQSKAQKNKRKKKSAGRLELAKSSWLKEQKTQNSMSRQTEWHSKREREKKSFNVLSESMFQSGAEGRHGPSKASSLGVFVNVYRSNVCVPLMHKVVCKHTLLHVSYTCGKEKEEEERIQVVSRVCGDASADMQVISSLSAGCGGGGGGGLGGGLSSCPRGAWPACLAAPSARRSCCPAAPAASAGSCERLPSPAGCSPDAAPDRWAEPPASGSSTPCPETNGKNRKQDVVLQTVLKLRWLVAIFKWKTDQNQIT